MDIEKIIQEFIEKKIEGVKKEAQKCIDEENKLNELNQKAYENLLAFEDRHRDELESIYTIQSNPWMWGRDSCSYFCGILNEIAQFLHYNKQSVERIKGEIGLFDGCRVLITYADFEKQTGLSSATVKKYLNVMDVKGSVNRKRHIGGYVYKSVCSG